jgi:hypothetical protein
VVVKNPLGINMLFWHLCSDIHGIWVCYSFFLSFFTLFYPFSFLSFFEQSYGGTLQIWNCVVKNVYQQNFTHDISFIQLYAEFDCSVQNSCRIQPFRSIKNVNRNKVE